MTFVAKWKNPSGTPTYTSWKNMCQRCYNPNAINFSQYGARGITVCDKWRHDYDAFVEDMGLKDKYLTLERINNNGNYEPGNCKWAPRRDQYRNRRPNRYLTYQGRTQISRDWAQELGFNHETFRRYIGKGFSVADIAQMPKPVYRRRYDL